nr:9620_t:CDS:2 [Entrophospora candida]
MSLCPFARDEFKDTGYQKPTNIALVYINITKFRMNGTVEFYTCGNLGHRSNDDRIVYAAVCKSDENKRFSINFGYTKAKYSTPLKAYLFVDGVWDYTYYQIYDNCYYVEDGFWNQERDKKFYFEFFTSNMNNDIIGSGSKRRRGRIERKGGKDVINGDDNVEKTSGIEKKSKKYTGGGPGTISVHFYKAEWHEYGVVKVPGFDVSQQKDHIKETAISTGFKEDKTKVRSKLPDRNKVTKKFDPKDINRLFRELK